MTSGRLCRNDESQTNGTTGKNRIGACRQAKDRKENDDIMALLQHIITKEEVWYALLHCYDDTSSYLHLVHIVQNGLPVHIPYLCINLRVDQRLLYQLKAAALSTTTCRSTTTRC